MMILSAEISDIDRLDMNRKIMLKIFAVILAAVTLLLCSCGKKYDFSADVNGNLVNDKNGVTYEIAPFCFEAIQVSDEVFAQQGDVQFFAITGADTSKWLCDSFGNVYYASDYRLPTLQEMGVDYVDVTEDDVVVNTVSDAALIDELRFICANGTDAEYPGKTGLAPVVNLRLRFSDKDIGICYVAAYLEYAEDYIYTGEDGKTINYGKKFIYDRANDNCISVDGLPAGVYGSNNG